MEEAWLLEFQKVVFIALHVCALKSIINELFQQIWDGILRGEKESKGRCAIIQVYRRVYDPKLSTLKFLLNALGAFLG